MLFKSLLCLLALWVVGPVTAQAADAASSDAHLEALVARIQTVELAGGGIGPAEQELAKQLNAYQGAAIPYLLPLLESKQAEVRHFAGYVLDSQDGLTEEHLEALIAAHQRGHAYVPLAIGRIGTPRAIKFLVDDLKTDPDYGSNSQVVMAIERVGEHALPDLLALFKDPAPLSLRLSLTLCDIFSAMGTQAGEALDPLLEIAREKRFELKNRLYAVKQVGCLRPGARKAIPALRALVSSDPEDFAAAVDEAIIDMGVPESVPLLVAILRSEPHMAMRDIAALRDNGRDAGPALAEYLSSGDADLRVGAARALGFIGYSEAADALIPLLKEPNDWRLVYVAVESLGRLRAPSAIPELENLDHWYPPVVDAARKAVKVIRGEEVYPSKRYHTFRSEFGAYRFAYRSVRADNAALPGQQIEQMIVRGPDELANDKLKELAHDVEIASHGRDGKEFAHAEKMGFPVCGLKTPNGFLLGSDQGEWGGELVFRSKQGPVVTLLSVNTMGVHRLSFGILAVTGHSFLPRGVLYLITPHDDGTFKASRWKTLPGTPRMSGMLSNGNLFISTFSGGNVVITPSGQIEMANKANTTRFINR